MGIYRTISRTISDIGLKATALSGLGLGVVKGLQDAYNGFIGVPEPPVELIVGGAGVGAVGGYNYSEQVMERPSDHIFNGGIEGGVLASLIYFLGYGLGQAAGRLLKG